MTPERLHRLLEALGGPREALAAPAEDFARFAGPKAAEALQREAPSDLAARLRREAEARGAGIVTRDQAAFPELLQPIFGPPGALYVEGKLEAGPALSLVGTRYPSEYGRRMARELAGALAGQGFTIVSGMAHGIDAEAHLGTLEAGGRTMAVLGCGLGVQYPSDHQELRAKIASQGSVISEFPWEATPYPANFPRRNRVISGLSAATIVIEAAHRSGALLTARLAAEQGREVMALPGPVHTGKSGGCHRLIKEGAQLVEGVEDILAALPSFVRSQAATQPQARPESHSAAPEAEDPSLPEAERALLARLGAGEDSIEGLSRSLGMRPEEVSGALLQLEIRGRVRRTGGGLYRRA
ncbi:MAG: DNA protecting protein DprA [Candidatus Tectomicrobia bacterium RIFCSPLOWO2_12_FULL_69_37]|nr:MAG: DNA protecting protein DprA [Candidatus Tectomicrobia bacterium RIFCSPLOWO2_02_FULL_70_19]OGL66685.1 MAG: DNA protecting protein DprA [Candidatus Tectomicrobia bacterium RIFCSPLOWO2_12_FULL_69_37]